MENPLQNENNDRLAELFRAYRDVCPDPEPGVNFMPHLWAKIEAREASRNVFGRMAKVLVTAAIAASMILGLMISAPSQSSVITGMTYVQALAADHVADLDPLQLERLAEMEQ